METYYDYVNSLLHKEDSIVMITCKMAVFQNSGIYCSDLDICDDGEHRICRLVESCKRKRYYANHPGKLEELINKYQ